MTEAPFILSLSLCELTEKLQEDSLSPEEVFYTYLEKVSHHNNPQYRNIRQNTNECNIYHVFCVCFTDSRGPAETELLHWDYFGEF